MTDPATIFAQAMPRPVGDARVAQVYAPANIALSKYWGKRNEALNLPLNSSLSISLGDWGTRTRIAPGEVDRLTFNGKALNATDPAAVKIWRFVDLFCGSDRVALQIETVNSIPTAAGLASSASGFAALTGALDAAFGTGLPKNVLSMLSRFGSGSATRSFWRGFVRWNRGEAPDGTDSFAVPVTSALDDLRVAIVAVDTGPKAHSSRDGMNHTVATSPLFAAWPDRAEADCALIEVAIRDGDFETVGQLAEANALAMHATMMAARPALTYLKAASWLVLETLWQARADGLQAYATMDAGANVKLIFPRARESDVIQAFPKAQLIDPFASPP